jgi:hypothetical protein
MGSDRVLVLFWQCLTKAMEAVGMKVSKLDPCLFVVDRVMAVAYVDDILFWATDEAYINKLFLKLHKRMMQLDFLASK